MVVQIPSLSGSKKIGQAGGARLRNGYSNVGMRLASTSRVKGNVTNVGCACQAASGQCACKGTKVVNLLSVGKS